jgi:hypothetical protein
MESFLSATLNGPSAPAAVDRSALVDWSVETQTCSHCQPVYHKSHMDYHLMTNGPTQWAARNPPPWPQCGLFFGSLSGNADDWEEVTDSSLKYNYKSSFTLYPPKSKCISVSFCAPKGTDFYKICYYNHIKGMFSLVHIFLHNLNIYDASKYYLPNIPYGFSNQDNTYSKVLGSSW